MGTSNSNSKEASSWGLVAGEAVVAVAVAVAVAVVVVVVVWWQKVDMDHAGQLFFVAVKMWICEMKLDWIQFEACSTRIHVLVF